MLNRKIVFSVIGQLLFIEALLLLAAMGVGYVYREDVVLSFGLPLALAVALGVVCKGLGRGFENRMSRRDGVLIVSLTWVLFSAVGTLPFLLSGAETRLSCAFFEAMSGFTTTGASVLAGIDTLPHSINFWRCLSHWVGGIGIVFFTLAILPQMGVGEQKLFSAEAARVNLGRLHPRIRTSAHWIGGIYVFLTVACAASFYAVGMNPFDALCHALSAAATGGFSTHQDSIGFFHSLPVEAVALVFMLLSSINFQLIYLALVKHRWRDAWNNAELRCFVLVLLLATGLCTLTLTLSGRPLPEALRSAAFHVVSIGSTAGFTTEDFMLWPAVLWLPLVAITIIGGCAGSTSGGMKCVRILLVWKLLVSEFRQILHPHAVFPLHINRQPVSVAVARSIFAFLVCFLGLTLVCSALLMGMGLPMLDAVSCCITTLSNVGPGIGYAVGPLTPWEVLPDGGLWLCSFLMLAGRLEIFSLLLPFLPAFWQDN